MWSRRTSALALLLCLVAAPAAASFTSVNRNSTSSAGSATTLGVAVTGVHVGDLIFVWSGNDGSQTVSGVSDGTTSLTCLTGVVNTSMNGRICYLLASVASGTVTYTATFAAAATSRFIGAWAFTPSASASFDQQNSASDTTALSSGNITTVGSDVLVVAGDINDAGVHTALQIGGVNATATDSDANGAFWYRATTGTVAATGTATAAGRSITAIASFAIAAGLPPASNGSLMLLGAGR